MMIFIASTNTLTKSEKGRMENTNPYFVSHSLVLCGCGQLMKDKAKCSM